jgi:hypothetical protein
MKIKENIEAGMYFSIKHDSLHHDVTDVYKIDTNNETGYMTLNRYQCDSKTGEYTFIDLVSVRRIGENSLDYYKHDMFGKKTRGRIHYIQLESFFYIKQDAEGNDYTHIEKAA